MAHNNGQQFSTVDMDNDNSTINCALERGGPWWNGACSHVKFIKVELTTFCFLRFKITQIL